MEPDFVIFVGPTREQLIAEGHFLAVPAGGLTLPDAGEQARVLTCTAALMRYTEDRVRDLIGPDPDDHLLRLTAWAALGITAQRAVKTPDNPDGYLLTASLNMEGPDDRVWFVRDSGAGQHSGPQSYTVMLPSDY